MTKPNFFISGAPRCGTTALYTYLSEHPQVFMSAVKELNYFASDFPHVQKINFQSDADYERVFAQAGPQHLAVGEASPFYLFSRVAFEKMYTYDSNARVIVTLRNPVEFIHSYHQLNLSLLRENEKDLARAWGLQEARCQGKSLPLSVRQVDLLMYGELGKFSQYVQRLYAVFPREQVKIFLFDDFRHDVCKVYEETLAFLGVPSDGREVFPQINANFENRSQLLARLFHPPQPVYRLFMRVISLFGVNFMKNFSLVYNKIERLNTTEASRSGLSLTLRAQMQAHFRSDIESLADLLERDLSGWLAEEKDG